MSLVHVCQSSVSESAYLSWMIDGTCDLLGVTFKGSNNFTGVLVKYDSILVSTTCNQRKGGGGELSDQ